MRPCDHSTIQPFNHLTIQPIIQPTAGEGAYWLSEHHRLETVILSNLEGLTFRVIGVYADMNSVGRTFKGLIEGAVIDLARSHTPVHLFHTTLLFSFHKGVTHG
jgi:hypothetical protein